MLSNTIVKLSAVFLFATPAVLIGGEVYSVLTGSTPLEGFLKIYSVLYIIPGDSPLLGPRSYGSLCSKSRNWLEVEKKENWCACCAMTHGR